MNCWVGGDSTMPPGVMDNKEDPSGKYLVYSKYVNMANPGPAMTFLILDERQDSINDSYFCVEMFSYDRHQMTKSLTSRPAIMARRAVSPSPTAIQKSTNGKIPVPCRR
jgi:hypothetical protein